ncbi:hypothetical protein HOO65_050455 [Ceratocystis lukuohia]|uniref:Reverse transcriptase Ty1/copia-type domain-containing protein n=1 Tax=Ceratocystis lukuohia TaxID=2019550 RepID=A0ABR4MGD8_9PEZI
MYVVFTPSLNKVVKTQNVRILEDVVNPNKVTLVSRPQRTLRPTALSVFTKSATPRQALAASEKWRVAIDKEIENMLEYISSNKTSYGIFSEHSELSTGNTPEGRSLIPMKWVFKVKLDGKYKARLVARGDKQKEGIDYNKTFASTAHTDSWRILMACAVPRPCLLIPHAHGRIWYSESANQGLKAYTEAAFGDHLDRRSTSGYPFKLAGSPVSWRTVEQTIQAGATADAEYIAATLATKQARFLRNLLGELATRKIANLQQPLFLHCDRTNAIANMNRPEITKRSLRIDAAYHFVHDAVQQGWIKRVHVGTQDMAADGLTKALVKIKRADFTRLLSLTDSEVKKGASVT